MIISIELYVESFQDVVQFDATLKSLIQNKVEARHIGMKVIFRCEGDAIKMIKDEFDRRMAFVRQQYDISLTTTTIGK